MDKDTWKIEVKDQVWKLEITNNIIKDLVLEHVDNELLRCSLTQQLKLQNKFIYNIKEVLDNERNNSSK